ncbi:MAG: formate--tetrahydrofolate ligase, partial [Sulfurovum sp.]
RHITNITKQYNLPVVVSINHFTFDTDDETKLLKRKCEELGVKCVISTHWADGGVGAVELANEIVDIVDNKDAQFNYLYDEKLPLWEKIESIATKIYGAKEIVASAKIRKEIDKLQETYGRLPICMAKTQMSFSTDPLLRGAPKNHIVEISEVKLENGAGFIVVIAGNMMTMPGLPKIPTAEKIDIDNNGMITGLF